MALITLTSLRAQSLQRADMVNSSFIDTTAGGELDLLINRSARELYDLLTGAYTDYFFQTYPFTTASPNDTYALPSGFYKALGVDQILNGSTGQAISIKPFQFAERNSYTGLSIFDQLMKLHYIPTMTPLVAASDTFDGVNGWEEYIVIDVAISLLNKEESDVSLLVKAKQDMAQRINGIAKERDAGAPERVTDIHRVDPFFYVQIPSQLRYRILGGNLKFVQTYAVGTVYE